jgi:hypothetical protein
MHELVQGLLKFWCLHVVGEAPEAGISPTCIDGVATRMPQTAKSSHVPITNPSPLKRAGQPLKVELRVVTRARDRANVDQLVDAVSKQQSNKILQCSSRVSHR